jgi:hypothetical protein
MTERVARLPAAEFANLWNAADTLAEAADAVKAVVGMPCPRWAVRARAQALRRDGVPFRLFPPARPEQSEP